MGLPSSNAAPNAEEELISHGDHTSLVPDGEGWIREYVDKFTSFDNLGNHSLVLDIAGHPHIALGQNHLYHKWYDEQGWHSQIVDYADGVGQYTSLALDPAGQLHISYADTTNGNLKYASSDGATWHTETINDRGSGFEYTSLAFETDGRPHIAYYDVLDADLEYTCLSGTTWITITVDSSGDVGQYASLALDSTGHPHIAYYDATHRDLHYASLGETGWVTETVSSDYMGAGSISLAIDSLAHMSYTFEQYDLRYAYYDGSAWQVQIEESWYLGAGASLALDSTGRSSIAYGGGGMRYAKYENSWQIQRVEDGYQITGTSLALDRDDRPHISYCAGDLNGYDSLKYAYYDGSFWHVETITSTGYMEDTSLALDSDEHPHIAYYDPVQYNLNYAFYDGIAWQIQVVDSTGDVGRYMALALDSLDRPHIAYYDATNGDLKYAYQDQNDTWRLETVDSGGNVGREHSLLLDSLDQPHISYSDAIGALKYAHWTGSSWQIEIVDNELGQTMPLYNDLEMAGDGSINIAYYDGTSHILKFARYNGAGWQVEQVDTADYVGEYASLEFTPWSEPHIGYCDFSTGGLKRAYLCTAIDAVSILGPATLQVGEMGAYTATYTNSATMPITVTWDNGGVGATVVYSWTQPGIYTLTVTATNPCAVAVGTAVVSVAPELHYIFVPLVVKNGTP